MKQLENDELIRQAQSVLGLRNLTNNSTAGSVASALQTKGGSLYLGVCIDVMSGIGFCAEHSAIAAMITAGESEISKIVAIKTGDVVLLPCGRCREFMHQVDATNYEGTQVILDEKESIKLKDLLPNDIAMLIG